MYTGVQGRKPNQVVPIRQMGNATNGGIESSPFCARFFVDELRMEPSGKSRHGRESCSSCSTTHAGLQRPAAEKEVPQAIQSLSG